VGLRRRESGSCPERGGGLLGEPLLLGECNDTGVGPRHERVGLGQQGRTVSPRSATARCNRVAPNAAVCSRAAAWRWRATSCPACAAARRSPSSTASTWCTLRSASGRSALDSTLA